MPRKTIVRQAFTQYFKGIPLKRCSDQIRYGAGLPLLTAERYTVNISGCNTAEDSE